MTTISVALATYNGSEFLLAQLQSLSQQTEHPDELVVCDDQSSDQTVDIIKRYAQTAPFKVRLIENERRVGYRLNFLKCASHCLGDFIAFCDQDDVWTNTKLFTVKRALEGNSECKLVYHNATAFDKDGELGPLLNDSHKRSSSAQSGKDVIASPLGFTLVFRRDLLEYMELHKVSRDPNNFRIIEAHDQWIYFLAQSTGQIVYLPNALVHYRQHSRNSYGWGKKPFIARWVLNICNASQRQTNLWICTARRRRILSKAADEADVQNSAIVMALTNYTRLEKVMRLRKESYTSKLLRRQLRGFISMVILGLYGPSSGAFTLGFRG